MDPVFESRACSLEGERPVPPRGDDQFADDGAFSREAEHAEAPSIELDRPSLENDRAVAPSPEPAPPDEAPSLSRDEAAERLGCSPRSVGRLVESGHLTPRRDERGRPWFAVGAVERLALERRRHARPDPGELAARAFARFDAGAGPRDLVVGEKLSPDEALELHGRWVAMGGGVVIDGTRARRLADALGMSVLDLDIVERALLALRRVAGALRVPCSACGREGFVREAREFGPYWRCAECEAEASVTAWGHGG